MPSGEHLCVNGALSYDGGVPGRGILACVINCMLNLRAGNLRRLFRKFSLHQLRCGLLPRRFGGHVLHGVSSWKILWGHGTVGEFRLLRCRNVCVGLGVKLLQLRGRHVRCSS